MNHDFGDGDMQTKKDVVASFEDLASKESRFSAVGGYPSFWLSSATYGGPYEKNSIAKVTMTWKIHVVTGLLRCTSTRLNLLTIKVLVLRATTNHLISEDSHSIKMVFQKYNHMRFEST